MAAKETYTDTRELLDEYSRHRCPECGVERWFQYHEPRTGRAYWSCEVCSAWLHEALELPCPECDLRMERDDDEFRCRNVECPVEAVEIDRDELINRLTGEHEVSGYDRGSWNACPFCGERSILCGPDGELACDECESFYVSQYSDEWYCYAIWLDEPERIRVNR